MTDIPPLTDQAPVVQSIEFRDQMVVVNFTEPDELKHPVVQNHTSQVILLGADEEVDAQARSLYQEVQEMLNVAHVARRRPPDTRPARR